jgi:hypothetical protein
MKKPRYREALEFGASGIRTIRGKPYFVWVSVISTLHIPAKIPAFEYR